MKSYTLNNKSWHFYLASEWGRKIYIEDGPIDICTYIRRVLSGLAKFILIGIFMSLIIGLFIGIEGSFLYAGYQMLFGDLSTLNNHVQGLACCGVVINLVLAFASIKIWMQENNIEITLPRPQESGFLSLAYKKFKSKTCFMVEFKETK